MTTNDDHIITGERVTAEFAALQQGQLDQATAAWIAHYESCLVFCQTGRFCPEGQRLQQRLAQVTSQGGHG